MDTDDNFEDRVPEDLEDIEVIYSDGEDEGPQDLEEFSTDQDSIEAEVIDVSSFTFTQHTKSVFNSAVSKDGNIAVTGGEDDVAYVWSTDTGQVLFECTGHKDSVTEVVFNHNDQYIATGDMGGLIQVWSTKDKNLVWCFEGDEVEWLLWHPTVNVLFCGCQSGDIYVWQIPSGNCKVLPSPSNISSTCAKLHPNEKQLLAGYQDGMLRLWDIKEASALWTNTESTTITAIDLSADGSLAVTAPKAQIVKTTDGKTIGAVLLDGETEIEAALFNNELGVIVTGSLSGQLCVWQLGKFVLRHQAQIECAVTLLKSGPDHRVFVGATDGAVYVCDVKGGTLLDVLSGHNSDIFSVSVFADGDRILTTSDDGTAKIFDVKSK